MGTRCFFPSLPTSQADFSALNCIVVVGWVECVVSMLSFCVYLTLTSLSWLGSFPLAVSDWYLLSDSCMSGYLLRMDVPTSFDISEILILL